MILGEIANAIIKEKAKFVAFSGDLVLGGKTDAEVESQLQTWLGVMKPVYNSGLKVYAVRGNHETYCQHPNDVWQKTFVGKYAMPSNGPAGEKGMTYSVAYKNALIVGFDQFQTDKARINQPWLDGVLKKNQKQHLFLMAHEMAFRAGKHTDNMDNDVPARDAFWSSIAKAGGRTYFSGHDHLYDRTAISAPGWPSNKAIQQYILGTAGAPFYHSNDHDGANSTWIQSPIKHIEDEFGYAVVDVDGPKVTITFKTRKAPGVFVAADTWSYIAPIHVAPKKKTSR